MSFFDNPIANISGGIHDIGKGISNATKNPLVDMAAAAALDYFTGGVGGLTGAGGLMDTYTGLGAAGNAALLTGGIAGLSSGNLAQGLMAGMAGYGGASLGEGLGMGHFNTPITYGPADAGTNEMWSQANASAGPTAANPVNVPASVAGSVSPDYASQYANANVGDFSQATSPYTGNPAVTPGGGYNYNLGPDGTPLSQTATQMPTTPAAPTAPAASTATTAAADTATKKAADTTLWQDFKALPTWEKAAIGVGGIGLLKSAAQPQKMTMPNSPNTQFIRYGSYSPMGGYTHQGMVPAVGGGAATGGLVALAHGGAVEHYDDGGTTGTSPYTQYSQNDIINYIQSHGIANDPTAINAAVQQYHGDPAAAAQALATIQGQTQAPAPVATAPVVNAQPVAVAPQFNTSDITQNPNGTRTVTPMDHPVGGFADMQDLVNSYQIGGGSTGNTLPQYQNIAQFNAANNTLTGGSKSAYDYLMGKSPWNPLPNTPTGEVSVPYAQLMGMQPTPQYQVNTPQIYDQTTHTYVTNPNYDPNFSATKDYLGVPQTGLTNPNALKTLGYIALPTGMMAYSNGDGSFTGIDGKKYNADGTVFGNTTNTNSSNDTSSGGKAGGLMSLASGGVSVGHLGGYSDGGRLLRGPGDGVSDSIPATIGSSDPEPARLADGEFVVPARIVSELGNGSTEAGARQLYKMMDRIQQARTKTTGKDAVATNTNAHKYLPA